MKRHGSSAGLCHQTLGVEDEDVDGQKKRRLSVDQVKALEKNFDRDNKLEPDRKLKLAQQLGLQPRQVAVWFQNRRARWKTKQLETDYHLLKANFDSLTRNYDSLKQDNQSLIKQIMELKSKLYGEEEESDGIQMKEDKPKTPEKIVATTYFSDGSSDSDSSPTLNEENNSSSMVFIADLINCSHQATESNAIMEDAQKAYEPQFVKIEEDNFFDESCNYFADDQGPIMQWY